MLSESGSGVRPSWPAASLTRRRNTVRRPLLVALFNVPWAELTVEVERFIDLGEQVLTPSHFDGTGRDGVEVRLPLAHLWTLRDGLVPRMDAFSDHADALEAVGLSE